MPTPLAPAGAPRAVRAPAKINLSLRVLAREASGFHQIESLFCRLELADELEVGRTAHDVTLELATPAELSTPPPDLGPAEQNLAVRAARLFLERTGTGGGAAIRLVKRIPTGAGLGGGSSDAAAVLRALNALSGAVLDEDELVELAGALGSDVPFFAAGAPLALAWSRGNRLLPLPPLPSLPVVLVVPAEAISTAETYAELAARRGAGYSAPAAVLSAPRSWADVVRVSSNDFEEVVLAARPRLSAMRVALAADAMVARLTGTGSVVYGVFADTRRADRAAQRIAAAFPEVRTIVTRTAGTATI